MSNTDRKRKLVGEQEALPDPEQIKRLAKRWAVVLTLVCSVGFTSASYINIIRELNDRITLPLVYRARAALHRTVEMSPKFKLLLFDDKTFAELQRPSLALKEWADLLAYIDTKQPAAIFIDKLFGITEDMTGEKDTAFAKLKTVKAPVYTGLFAAPNAITFRETFKGQKPLYDVKTYLEPNHSVGPDFTHIQGFVYGPHPEFLPYFTPVQIIFRGFGRFSPLMVDGDRVYPHLGMMALKSFKIDGNSVVYDEGKVRVDRRGTALVNYMSVDQFFSRAKPIKALLRTMKAGEALKYIEPGDHVLILPGAYTGGTDFIESPYGNIYGGFLVGSVVNSALTGQWLTEMPGEGVLIALCCLIGAILALAAGIKAWLLLALALSLIILSGIGLFSFASLSIPWVYAGFSCSLTAITVFASKARFDKKIALLHDLIQKRNLSLEAEKKEASIIASAFLPDAIPAWNPVTIEGFHRSFDEASGDWFFFEKSDDGRYFNICLCDITGHGIQAALIVSTCKTALNSFKMHNPEALQRPDFMAAYISVLSQILFKQGKSHHNTTLAGVMIEPAAKLVHYITCGHPSPLLLKKGETKPKALRTRHNPLGFDPDSEIVLSTQAFEPGDELIIFTDGIPLRENLPILTKFLKERRDDPSSYNPQKLYDMTWERNTEKTGKLPDDDISLIFCRFTPVV